MPFDGHIHDDIHDLSKFDFPCEMWNLDAVSPNHERISVDPSRSRAVVRTDTGTVLGVHGSRYKLRPFGEAVERISDALLQAAPNECMEITDEVFEEGAKMRRSIKLPNLKIEPQLNDITSLELLFWSSHDGGWSEQYITWGNRLWCLNGCTTTDFSVRASIRHVTVEWKRDDHIERLKRGIDMFFRSETQFKHWVSKRVTEDDVEALFKRTIAYVNDRSRHPEERFAAPTFKALWSKFEREPNTVWGVYNAATNWATHPDTRGLAHNVSRQRHNRVAQMMKSDQWLSLAA